MLSLWIPLQFTYPPPQPQQHTHTLIPIPTPFNLGTESDIRWTNAIHIERVADRPKLLLIHFAYYRYQVDLLVRCWCLKRLLRGPSSLWLIMLWWKDITFRNCVRALLMRLDHEVGYHVRHVTYLLYKQIARISVVAATSRWYYVEVLRTLTVLSCYMSTSK